MRVVKLVLLLVVAAAVPMVPVPMDIPTPPSLAHTPRRIDSRHSNGKVAMTPAGLAAGGEGASLGASRETVTEDVSRLHLRACPPLDHRCSTSTSTSTSTSAVEVGLGGALLEVVMVPVGRTSLPT